MNDHPEGLSTHDDGGILIKDREGNGFWFERKGMGSGRVLRQYLPLI